MNKAISFIDALDDPDLLRPALGKHVESWKAWRCFHKAVHGLPLDEPGELELFTKCTGRDTAPLVRASEVFGIIGRRGGKSLNIAIEAVFTCLLDTFWQPFLARGERGYFVIVAADKMQCRVIMDYCKGIIAGNKFFASMVDNETQEELSFKNSSSILIKAANFRSIRGFAFLGIGADELAFWRDAENFSNPASEILDAVRPALIPGAILFGISSAYARQGVLFEEHQQHFGQSGDDTLVWLADTPTMNSTFDRRKIDKAMQRDPSVAACEYFSVFRQDIEQLYDSQDIEAAVVPGRDRLPFVAGTRYVAATDPSGGRRDAAGICIVHMAANGRIIVDLAIERKAPHDPGEVIAEFAGVIKGYGLREVTGDRYGGAFPESIYRQRQVTYELATKTASEAYMACLPLFSSHVVELPESERLKNQLLSLMRRTNNSGRDTVVAGQGDGSHCDLANAVALALVTANEAGAGGEGVVEAYHRQSITDGLFGDPESRDFWEPGANN